VTTRRDALRRCCSHYLLAVFSAILYFLGFAGFDLWPLAFIALVPLFFILDGEPLSNRESLFVGFTFGFVTHAGAYYWLVGMLEKFSGFPLVACVFFAAVVCFYQGGQLALFFWLLARVHRRGWSLTWSAVPAYCAVEIIYPLLFPSFFSNSLHELPLFMQIVDLGGPIGLTAVIVAVNSATYELLASLFRKRSFRFGLPIAAAIAVSLTLIYGYYRCRDVDARVASAPKITVGVVQTNMGIFEKRRDTLEGYRRHLEQSLELERDVAPDLIVWPESAIQWIIRSEEKNVQKRVLGPLKTPIFFGGLAVRNVEGKRHIYNTAFITDNEGNILSTYDKVYLLAFGEYLPLGDLFPILYEWSPQSGQFTPGDAVRPMRFRDYQIAPLICYEDLIPGFVRQAVKEIHPDLLVNITNDSWFGNTNEPWIHLALAKFRAVEHHRFLIRATNSGVSAVIDPLGRMSVHSGAFERATLHAQVAMMHTPTLYQTVGDWPGWLALLWIIWAAFLRRR
jgi:apolipoprotein N-acyltransferase